MATRVIPSLRGPYEVVKPSEKHTATVIFLHGLGDSGSGWLGIVNVIKDELPHVKWLLPNAPSRSISANRGFVMSSWFDLPSWDLEDRHEDRDGMLDSARTIDQYIQDEIGAGLPAERIVVGGFSQGGSMSFLVGLTARGEDGLFGGRCGWKLGGVVVLSGWMPLQDTFPKMASPHLITTPVLMCHGTADTIVPYSFGQSAGRILTNDLHLPALENLTLSMLVPPSGHSPGEEKLGATGLSLRFYRSAGHEALTNPRNSSSLRQIHQVLEVNDLTFDSRKDGNRLVFRCPYVGHTSSQSLTVMTNLIIYRCQAKSSYL